MRPSLILILAACPSHAFPRLVAWLRDEPFIVDLVSHGSVRWSAIAKEKDFWHDGSTRTAVNLPTAQRLAGLRFQPGQYALFVFLDAQTKKNWKTKDPLYNYYNIFIDFF